MAGIGGAGDIAIDRTKEGQQRVRSASVPHSTGKVVPALAAAPNARAAIVILGRRILIVGRDTRPIGQQPVLDVSEIHRDP